MTVILARHKMKNGFTLVELLVVIAIIGVLAGILLTSLAKSKEAAHRVECLNFQRQLYIDVTAQSGETIILGGTRTSSKDRARNGVPGVVNSTNVISKLFGGVQNSDQEEELVVLVRANIIPAPQFNSLVSQSL